MRLIKQAICGAAAEAIKRKVAGNENEPLLCINFMPLAINCTETISAAYDRWCSLNGCLL